MFSRLTNANSEKAVAKAAAKAAAASHRKGLIPSVIASGMHVLGNIVSDGVLDIEGKIDGNVRGQTVTIRPDGIIRGDVVAETLHVYGAVEGLIKARNVSLYANARVSGTIMHESLAIEDGAMVDGKFKRSDRMAFEEFSEMPRRLNSPSLESNFSNDNDRDDEPSEAEIKILENLRLISY
jgi:cytoskeletal protein CcmA (bactofilin family)